MTFAYAVSTSVTTTPLCATCVQELRGLIDRLELSPAVPDLDHPQRCSRCDRLDS